MANKVAILLPSTDALLRQLGDRLSMARKRRRLPAKQLAQRAGMSPMTLRSLERGGSGVTMGAYLAVMQALGVETDLNLLAKADPLGRELQDANLPAPKKFSPMSSQVAKPETMPTPSKSRLQKLKTAQGNQSAKKLPVEDIFTSSESLAKLIKAPAPASKKAR